MPIGRKLYRRAPGSKWKVSKDKSEVTLSTADASITLARDLATPLREFDRPIDPERFVDTVSRDEDSRREWRERIDRLLELGILETTRVHSDRSRKTLLARPNKKSGDLVFVFSGIRGGMGLGEDALAFIKAAGLTRRNFALFRDLNRARYRLGLSEEIPDLRSLIDWMRKFRDEQSQVEHVYLTGNSMGSATAIICGHALGADAVVAYSIPWIENPDGGPEVDGIEWDLRKLLAKPNGRTQYHIYYAAQCEPDASNAAALEAFEGVHVYPLEAQKHNVIPLLAETGRLAAHFGPAEP